MSHPRQRGAAALMIVLFLLVAGSVAVITALSISGSDSGDTAYQHNSVAALALAESGLERVAGRLATTACTSLGTEGPYNLGQGSFSIVAPAPYIDTGWCRVRVSGTVGATTRIVDAWLSGGTIVLENKSSASGTTNTLSFPHTVSGPNQVLLVGIAIDQAKTFVWSVQYAGLPMTLAIGGGTFGNPRTGIYSLVNPPTGTSNVDVMLIFSDQIAAGAMSFSGVNATTPVEVTAQSTGNSAIASVPITPVTNNAWIVDALAADKGVAPTLGTVSPVVAGANRTQQWNLPLGTSITGAASLYGPLNPAGTSTLSWTLSTAKKWSYAAAALRPAGSARVARWSEVVN